jgi:YD repeat-containing protein
MKKMISICLTIFVCLFMVLNYALPSSSSSSSPISSPISSPSNSPNSSNTNTYNYDNLGRLTSVTYESGQSVEYSYDAGGNLLSSSCVQSGEPVDSATGAHYLEGTTGTTTSTGEAAPSP